MKLAPVMVMVCPAAPLDGLSRRRGRGFRLEVKGIGKRALREPRRHVAAAAGNPERDQRQHRKLRYVARAKKLGSTGHGYSLVRNKRRF